MRWKIIIFLGCISFATIDAQQVLYSECGNPVAHDYCANAPSPSLCEIDGFTATTENFTAGNDSIEALTNLFCGPHTLTHDNMWIKFVADGNHLSFKVDINYCQGIAGCIDGSGIQLAIVETDCISNFNSIACLNCDASVPLSADVIPGNTYYLMIDGCCGDICEFVINVLEGVAGTHINIDIPEESICTEDDTKTLVANMTPVDGDYSYHWHTTNGEILSDTSKQSILVQGKGEYFVDVHENITCCDESQFIDLGVDPRAPITSVLPPETITCKKPTVSLNGTFQGVNGEAYTQNWYDPDGNVLANWNINTGGEYSYVVVHSNTSCADTSMITVNVDTISPTALAISNDTLNCKSDNTIHLLGIQSTPLYNLTYQWLDKDGNLLAENPNFTSSSLETDYTLKVENIQNGCIDEMSITIPDERGDPIVDAGPDQTIDCNVNIVTLTANVNQGAAISNNFSYQWLDLNGYVASNDSSFTTITEDTYTLVVKNTDSGCSAQDEIVITNGINFPSITILAPTTITCKNAQVTLDASTSIGNSLGYEWSDVQGNILGKDDFLIVPDTGFYYLALQDTVSGCITRKTIKVIEDYRTPNDVTSNNGVLNCLVDSVILIGQTTSQLNQVTNQWIDASNNIISHSTVVTVTDPGKYYFISTLDSTGCSATSESIVTTSYNTPDITIESTFDTLNCQRTSIDMNVISNINNLEYTWSGPFLNANTDTITITEAGIYTVTITDKNNGCSNQLSKTIYMDTIVPNAVINIPDTINCYHTNIQLIAQTDLSNTIFDWTTSNGHFVGNINSLTPTVDKKGTYFLHLQSLINHCENTYEIDVVDNFTLPIVGAGKNQQLDCNHESFEIGTTESTHTSYQWLDENNNEIAKTYNYSGQIPGIYTLIATQIESGCTALDTVKITQDTTKPQAIIRSSTDERTCSKPTFVIAASTNIHNPNYSWQGPSSFVASTRVISINEGGLYQLMVENPDNGCTQSTDIEIKDNFIEPNIQMNTPDTLTCVQQNTALGFNSSDDTHYFHYKWQDENGQSMGEDSILVVTQPQIYTLITENTLNGCTTRSDINVFQNITQPEIDAGEDIALDCNTYNTTLNGIASSTANLSNFKYNWYFDGSRIDSNQTIQVSNFGIYQLEVIDQNNGCSQTDQVEVYPNREKPNAIGKVSNTLTCKDTIAVIDGLQSKTSTNGLLQYRWYKSGILIDTTDNHTISEPGTYKLVIEDLSNHCLDSTSLIVEENIKTPPLPDLNPDTLTCKIQTISVDARIPNHNELLYTWYDENMELIAQGNSKMTTAAFGNYHLVVTNKGNGCTNTLEVEIPVNREKPFAEALVDDELDCSTREITLLTGNSSTEHVDYFWDGPGIIPETNLIHPKVNAPGLYHLVIRDIINYCSDSAEVKVIEIENDLQVSIKSYDEICLNTQNGSIEIDDIQGGTPPFLYSINDHPFSDSIYFENLMPGQYKMEVKDARGCLFTDYMDIESWKEPTFNLGPDVTINIGQTVEITPTYSASNVDSLKWNASDLFGFNPILLPTKDRTINATLIDEDGCEVQDEMRIFVNLDYPIYVPNAFSPNGDGVNDIFLVFSENKAVKNIQTMIILDRWGNLVFENHDFMPNDPTQGWDGLFKEKPMNPGVFVYYFSVEFINGDVQEFKGDLTLLL